MKEREKNLIVEFGQDHTELVNSSAFLFIDKNACFGLIQAVLIHAKADEDLALSTDDHSALFKCLLHFNLSVNKDEVKLFNWDLEDGNIDEFVDVILPIQFKALETSFHKDYKIQFLKVCYFFSFAEKNDKYAALLNKFLEKLKLKHYQSYLWRILDVFLKLLTNEEETCKMIIKGDKHYLDFFRSLCVNGKLNAQDPDYLRLRQFPLYNPRGDEFIFLDYKLFVDKFYQSFLFDFASHSGYSFGNLKSDMGQYFSEHILFYSIMEKCFSKYGNLRLTGEQLKEKLISGEPDYYLREGSKVFVFEFKEITIRSDVKYSKNVSLIKETIIDKLEESKNKQAKGISQLLNTILDIKNGVYKEMEVDSIDPKLITVYPIIVVTDQALRSYGVNYFLQKRMDKIIAKTSLPKHKIKRVTLINLDTLIELQDYFYSGKLKLSNCINSYIQYVSTNHVRTASFPFDEFIQHYLFTKTNESKVAPADFYDIIENFKRKAASNYEQ